MEALDNPGSHSGSGPLTVAVASVLAAVALAGTLICLVYALWWLVVFWAPA